MPRDGRVVRERLQRAALELFAERGYDGATTSQIAERAGVTERTYFRHFADKREVLFASQEELQERIAAGLAAVPSGLEPLPALRHAFRDVLPLLEANRPVSEPRARIIAATPALAERELSKGTALVEQVAAALRERGVPEDSAALAAQIGMDALTAAIRRWMRGTPPGDLHAEVDTAFADLGRLARPLGS